MRIKARDSNPNKAAGIANTVAVVFSQMNQTEQAARYALQKRI